MIRLTHWPCLVFSATFLLACQDPATQTSEFPLAGGSRQIPAAVRPAPLPPDWPVYPANPFVIPVAPATAVKEERAGGSGGIAVHDLDADGLLDYLITAPGQITAYAHGGRRLWLVRTDIRLTSKAESEGLPGLHASGVQAGDPDQDGRAEVLFLSWNGELRVLDGSTGRLEWSAPLAPPFQDVKSWENLLLCDLRGRGERDLLLQASNPDGYRMGRYLAAYAFEDLLGAPLWTTDSYLGTAHSGVRVADLDGDGRDEILGATLFRPDGTLVEWTLPSLGVGSPASWKKLLDNTTWSWLDFPDYHGHLDAIHARDVLPDEPGLEILALQEGGPQRVFLYGLDRFLWQTDHLQQEPQNTAVADLDPDRPGLEVWCRSRHDRNQKPFVFDAQGRLIAAWEMSKTAPPGWTDKGIESIHVIDWDGGPVQYLAAKERHEAGDVAILDGLTGRFLHRFPTQAHRLLVADVSGDWREEILVLTDRDLRIWSNPGKNPDPGRPRLWDDPAYRRGKASWNYYAP